MPEYKYYESQPTVDPMPVTTLAHLAVTGDRNAMYSHPLDNFCRIAVLWSAVLKVIVTFKEVALCMNQFKVSREVNRAKRDNTIDGIGYLECLDMCYAERDRRLAAKWTFTETTGAWTEPGTMPLGWNKVAEDTKKMQEAFIPDMGVPLSGMSGTPVCTSEETPIYRFKGDA